MAPFRILTLGFALAVGGHALTIGQQPPVPKEPHRFLRTVAGFEPSQLDALDRGEPLAKVLDTDRRQIAVVGAIRIKAEPGRLIDRYRDVASLRNSPIVLQLGVFSSPPRVDDFQGLTFEPYDLQTIRNCKPGDCGVRLPAPAMARFNRDVDWRASNWTDQAAALWRQLLVDYTTEYQTAGSLAEYRNREEPLRVAEEFGVLFDDSDYFTSLSPDLFAYLRRYPRAPLDGVEDIFYWSKDNVGVRPVTSITHRTIYAPRGNPASPRLAIVATKQIWATHYFDAGFGLTIAFDDGASGFYMLSLNRARTRSLTGVMRSMIRSTVQRRSRDAIESVLRSTKASLERPRR